VQRRLFQEGQQGVPPGARLVGPGAAVRVTHPQESPSARGKEPVLLVVLVCGQGDLLQVIGALQPSGRLACRLHGRQKQCYQDANDRNDHEQLDQGKTV